MNAFIDSQREVGIPEKQICVLGPILSDGCLRWALFFRPVAQSADVRGFPSSPFPFFFFFPRRLNSTLSGSDSLFGPPLESAFKSKSFDGREQLRERARFGASECEFVRRPTDSWRLSRADALPCV